MTVPVTTDQPVRNPSSGCYYPLIKVELFVNIGDGKYGGIHYASIAWMIEQASDGTTWYSGWFAPHNDSGTFHHNETLDMVKLSDVLTLVEAFATRRFDQDTVESMGITSQYIRRNRR